MAPAAVMHARVHLRVVRSHPSHCARASLSHDGLVVRHSHHQVHQRFRRYRSSRHSWRCKCGVAGAVPLPLSLASMEGWPLALGNLALSSASGIMHAIKDHLPLGLISGGGEHSLWDVASATLSIDVVPDDATTVSTISEAVAADAGVVVAASSRLTPLDAYRASITANPLQTKMATSSILFAISDVLAQTVANSAKTTPEKIDYVRVARYFVFGATVHAPLFSAFYDMLDATFDDNVVPKVIVDQVVFTPFVFLPIFFGGMSLLSGEGVDGAYARVRENAWGITPTLINNWRVWVPANAVNYSLPSDVRILFVNVVALGWTVYLSTVEREAAAAASNARRT